VYGVFPLLDDLANSSLSTILPGVNGLDMRWQVDCDDACTVHEMAAWFVYVTVRYRLVLVNTEVRRQ
jgi:hypothetical protein